MVVQQMFHEDKWFEFTDERIKQFAAKAPKSWSNAKFVSECEKQFSLILSDPESFGAIYSKFRKNKVIKYINKF